MSNGTSDEQSQLAQTVEMFEVITQTQPQDYQSLEILKEAPRLGKHVFVSGRRDDNPVLGFTKAKAKSDKFCSKAKTPVDHWTLHDLRRTAATNMRQLGVDRLTVSKVLNHAEGGITKVYDRYAADPEKRRALERWARRLGALVGHVGDTKVVELRR